MYASLRVRCTPHTPYSGARAVPWSSDSLGARVARSLSLSLSFLVFERCSICILCVLRYHARRH